MGVLEGGQKFMLKRLCAFSIPKNLVKKRNPTGFPYTPAKLNSETFLKLAPKTIKGVSVSVSVIEDPN